MIRRGSLHFRLCQVLIDLSPAVKTRTLTVKRAVKLFYLVYWRHFVTRPQSLQIANIVAVTTNIERAENMEIFRWCASEIKLAQRIQVIYVKGNLHTIYYAEIYFMDAVFLNLCYLYILLHKY